MSGTYEELICGHKEFMQMAQTEWKIRFKSIANYFKHETAFLNPTAYVKKEQYELGLIFCRLPHIRADKQYDPLLRFLLIQYLWQYWLNVFPTRPGIE